MLASRLDEADQAEVAVIGLERDAQVMPWIPRSGAARSRSGSGNRTPASPGLARVVGRW